MYLDCYMFFMPELSRSSLKLLLPIRIIYENGPHIKTFYHVSYLSHVIHGTIVSVHCNNF